MNAVTVGQQCDGWVVGCIRPYAGPRAAIEAGDRAMRADTPCRNSPSTVNEVAPF